MSGGGIIIEDKQKISARPFYLRYTNRLIIMSPHSDYFDNFFIPVNLINQSMLDVDPPGVSSFQFTNEFFKRRILLKWILPKYIEQLFCFGF